VVTIKIHAEVVGNKGNLERVILDSSWAYDEEYDKIMDEIDKVVLKLPKYRHKKALENAAVSNV